MCGGAAEDSDASEEEDGADESDEECGVCGDDSNLCKNVGKSDPDSDYSHIDSSALEKGDYRISATPFSKELCNAANHRTRLHTTPYAIVDNARLLSK